MNELKFDVQKYKKDTRDELAKLLAKSLPLNLTASYYAALADTIATTKFGSLTFARSGGDDLIFGWTRDVEGITSIVWSKGL